MGHELAIDLDRGDLRAGGEEAAGQHAEARPDLEDPSPGRGRRGREDRLEHLDVGEEVLAEAPAGAEPGVEQRPPDGPRVQRHRRPRTAHSATRPAASASASRAAASASASRAAA